MPTKMQPAGGFCALRGVSMCQWHTRSEPTESADETELPLKRHSLHSLPNFKRFQCVTMVKCLRINKDKGKSAEELLQMLTTWQEQATKLSAKEISKEEYDQWRYNYPKFDNSQHWAKVPPQELSNVLAEVFKDKLKTD